LHFPDNADLTRPQTIKFPVGRFISEAGLKLTLTTTDGRTYTKNIYKSGIRTYNEKNGIFSARHLAKALYAFASPGGIESADESSNSPRQSMRAKVSPPGKMNEASSYCSTTST